MKNTYLLGAGLVVVVFGAVFGPKYIDSYFNKQADETARKIAGGRTVNGVDNADAIETKTQTEQAVAPQKFNTMPVNVFKATMPTQPVDFIVIGQISDYYNYEFSDRRIPQVKDNYFSVKVCDYDDKYECLNGFILKDDGQEMFSKLQDGGWHVLKVSLAYPPSKGDSGIAVLSVARVVN